MPLKNYCVLKGTVYATDVGGHPHPHFQVHIKGEEGEVDYRIAVNIQSQAFPSEVLYFVSEDFKSEDITILPTLENGITKITNKNQDIALDYIRGGLFDPKKMVPLPDELPGEDNDLSEKLRRYIEEAKEKNAIVYAFGERWGPESREPDQYFNFTPGNGIHDIHMNQGNVGRWKRDNGSWQDGGMLIHFEEENRWVGIFLAFQSQSWCTDEDGNTVKPVEECNHENSGNQS